MATPTVTITVGGVPVGASSAIAAADAEDALYMTYVQAAKDGKRYQFVLFPNAISALGAPTLSVPTMLFLRRKQERPGNRSKWFHHRMQVAHKTQLLSELDKLAERGYELGGLVVVPLEKDDYQSVWNGQTPHKALRAVDRALDATHSLSVK